LAGLDFLQRRPALVSGEPVQRITAFRGQALEVAHSQFCSAV
jgi:hypothetical protein